MELELIDWLRSRLGAHPNLLLGIGDDAAVLRLSEDRRVVVSTDMLTAGVDFVLPGDDPVRIGCKSLAVNLSDLAAMAARPLAAVVSLALPKSGGLELAKQLYQGMLPLAAKYQLAIAGGDTNAWDGPLVISVTVLGEPTAAGPFLRSGARPGDAIVVTGQFGGSRLGHQFDFEPRVTEALWLAEHAEVHAAIDVSDGLSLDLGRIAQASRCGAIVDVEKIPARPAVYKWTEQQTDGSTAVDHMLSDGEDFELILAIPQEEAQRLVASQPLGCGLAIIGQFVTEPGLWQRQGQERKPLAARGFLHG